MGANKSLMFCLLTATCTKKQSFLVCDVIHFNYSDIIDKHASSHEHALTCGSNVHAHVNSPFEPVTSQPRAD